MNNSNRFREEGEKQPNLEEICQYLVRSERELKELKRVLRNAPVTLAEGIVDLEYVPPYLAYFFHPNDFIINVYCSDEIDSAGIEGVKLSERDFHRCIEVLVDPSESIPRDYEEAVRCGWDVSNYNGNTTIGKEQLGIWPHLADTLEVYSNKSQGQVVVTYSQSGKNYLISFLLFDKDRFHYPYAAGLGEEAE